MKKPREPWVVRLNDDGTLDEVCAHGAFVHLEQMDDDQWWLGIDVGGRSLHVNLWTKRNTRIHARAEEDR